MRALQSSARSAASIFTAITRLLASDRSLAARVADCLALLREAVPFDDGRLIYWSAAGDPSLREETATPSSWDLPWPDHEHVIRQRTPIRIVQHPHDPVLPPSIVCFSAPVVWNNTCWGLLTLRSADPDAFSSSGQTFVESVLQVLAGVLADDTSTNGHHSLVRMVGPRPDELSTRQMDMLAEVRANLEQPLPLSDLLALMLRWALDATGAEAGAISLVDHERGELFLQHDHGYPTEVFSRDSFGEPRRRWSWNIDMAGKVARTGRALLLRDVSRDGLVPIPEIRAELAVPMLDQGRAVAVMVLDSPRSTAFGESELLLVQALCALATRPLLRARWFQQAFETSTELGQVFSSISDGLALLDKQGRVLRQNPAWSQVWGIEPNSANAEFHMPWDLVPRLLTRLTNPMGLSDFCAAGQTNPTDVQHTTIVLREPHQELEVLSTPTRDSLGQLTGRLWVVSDVTRERESDRLKSEFISIVSHELRTPLTSILGYTELLLARTFTPTEQLEFIRTVYDQAHHLSQIVEDLLGVSRLEAGNVKLNQWVVSMRQLINELTAQLHNLSNRHRLVIDMPQRLPPAYVDRDKVKQILVNLLTNAVKYSPRGGEIILSVHEATHLPDDHPEGRFMLLQVKDTGLGIAPEDLPHIWERFYRVDNSNTRRIGGTGLGLSITRALVELHGGQIWADSVVNKGSTFSFTLPIATDIVQRAPNDDTP